MQGRQNSKLAFAIETAARSTALASDTVPAIGPKSAARSRSAITLLSFARPSTGHPSRIKGALSQSGDRGFHQEICFSNAPLIRFFLYVA